MFALVESGKITQTPKGNKGIQIGDIKYPAAIYTLWSEAERNAIGIYTVEIDSTNKKDEEWYINTNQTMSYDSSANKVKVTLTANVTFDAPTNPTTGQYISIVCIQDGTGSRTIAWNAVFEFKDDTAPTATTTASKGDMFTFRYNGSKWLEVGRNLNLTLS